MGCSASSHRAPGKRTLREADLSFLIQNTRMQEAEVRASYSQFIRQHPDGLMDRETFRLMMKDCYPSADIGNIETHLFRMYDDNEDGVIDFREFMTKVHIMSNGSPEENLRQLFRILDIDNNRTVSISEFKKVVTDLQMMSENDNNMDNSIRDLIVEKAFIEMDVNGDGMVTIEEFIKACLSQKKFSTMLTLKLINVFLE